MNAPAASVVVKDANIIIDLINGNLLAAWVQLGITTFIPDMVESELKRGSQWHDIHLLIASQTIIVESIPAADIPKLLQLKRQHNVSVQDGSVLHLASSKNARLLTGDRKLRLAAESSEIEVSGVLWVLDTLVAEEVIHPQQACEGLRLIMQHGARLPIKAVEERIERWS